MRSFSFTGRLIMILFLSGAVHSYAAFDATVTAADTMVDFSMMGYAAVSGEGYDSTTGGAGGDTVHIYTLEELTDWAGLREDATAPEIAVIHGKITATASTVVTIKHGANISVLGVDTISELVNVGLNLWDYKNVIVFNLKIHEVFYPNDAITINECQHVWIDHCELHSLIGEGIDVDTYDGLLDIKNGSRYVTVSWCYLHDHMKTCLIGHTDNAGQLETDTMMRVTFHHNYFRHTDGRNPSLRFGAVHMFGNYLEDISDYGIAVRQGGHAKLDNNHFHSVNTPITTDKFDGPEGFVCESGTLYSGTCSAADNSVTQTDCAWWNNLPYEFKADPVDRVAYLAQQYTGVGKTDKPGGAYIPDTNDTDTTVSGNRVKLIPELNRNNIGIRDIFPNPMTDKADIPVWLPHGNKLNIRIFNLQGKLQSEMALEYLSPGENIITLYRGNLLPGVYLIRFEFEKNVTTKRLAVSD